MSLTRNKRCVMAALSVATISLLLTLCCRLAKCDEPAVRRLVFPKEFSCGKLYVSNNPKRRWLDTGYAVISGGDGRFVGDAKGTVTIPAGPPLYFYPSYECVEHPEALKSLSPNALDCVNFGTMGVLVPLDRIVEPISRFTGLRRLDLDQSEIPDEKLAKLNTLVNLEALSVGLCALHGTFLKQLSTSTKLKELNFTDNVPDSHTFEYISHFQELVKLNLAHCGVKDGDLVYISKLKNLEDLNLNRSLISVKGLAYLKNCKRLKYLDVSLTSLKVDDLLGLADLKLVILYLPKGACSDADLKKLKKAMPLTAFNMSHTAVDAETTQMFAPLH